MARSNKKQTPAAPTVKQPPAKQDEDTVELRVGDSVYLVRGGNTQRGT